ncbi:MAG: hypothetical protein ABIL67_07975, partial [candidate division WOR-3 bacterium]
MVEFSLFYMPLPINPFFSYYEKSPKFEVIAKLSQNDFFLLKIKPDSLPEDFKFPMALKVASNNTISAKMFAKIGDWGVILNFPNLNSSPIFGTSSLPSYDLPLIRWKPIDLTIYDTLEPVEIDSLRAKTPIVWHLKGYAAISPIVESNSNVIFFPLQFSLLRDFEGFGLGISGGIGFLWGKGKWKAKYVGSEFILDTFWVEGVKMEADLFKQLYSDSLGYYEFNFSADRHFVYSLGLSAHYSFENFKFGLSGEYLPQFDFKYEISGRYMFVDSLYGKWIRKYSNFDGLYAEYSGDTALIKGSGVVGFMSEFQDIKSGSIKGNGNLKVSSGIFYSVYMSYNPDRTRFATLMLSNRGLAFTGSFGWDYGIKGFVFYPLKEEFGYWNLGFFAEFEGFNFYIFTGRNFGKIKTPYFTTYISPLSGKLQNYIY